MGNEDLIASIKAGDMIAGKYRVEGLLGRGAMGVVLRAHHEALDERVAIKVLLPEAVKNEVVLERFRREARATAKIKSEHVATVYDVGALEKGLPYIVMELLEGEDLQARLKREGKLPVAEAMAYVAQACRALVEAHALGIVHRDLKPENLFVTKRRDGSEIVKVVDFGIAKAMSPSESVLTQTATALGSPLYMSPEQIRSPKTVDHRSDLWTLGVVLYELLTKRPPFVAKELGTLAIKIVTEEPPPLTRRCPDASTELVALIDRCLRKRPEERFQTASELLAALEGLKARPAAAPEPATMTKPARARRPAKFETTVALEPDDEATPPPAAPAPVARARASVSSAAPPSVPPPMAHPSPQGRPLIAPPTPAHPPQPAPPPTMPSAGRLAPSDARASTGEPLVAAAVAQESASRGGLWAVAAVVVIAIAAGAVFLLGRTDAAVTRETPTTESADPVTPPADALDPQAPAVSTETAEPPSEDAQPSARAPTRAEVQAVEEAADEEVEPSAPPPAPPPTMRPVVAPPRPAPPSTTSKPPASKTPDPNETPESLYGDRK